MTGTLPDLMPPAVSLPDEVASLRGEVRAFVAGQIRRGAWQPQIDGWLSGWNPEFSKELAARGWIGMTIPKEYGGTARALWPATSSSRNCSRPARR